MRIIEATIEASRHGDSLMKATVQVREDEQMGMDAHFPELRVEGPPLNAAYFIDGEIVDPDEVADGFLDEFNRLWYDASVMVEFDEDQHEGFVATVREGEIVAGHTIPGRST